eukprot:458944_1
MYQCGWIGCYCDSIEHLKNKCKYGAFINNATIQAIRDQMINVLNDNNINAKQTNINNNMNKSICEISRAELTSCKVFWEQIYDSDQYLLHHIYFDTCICQWRRIGESSQSTCIKISFDF